MKSSIFAVFAGLAAMANAYTKANMTVDASGNPFITPSEGQTVPAGKPFDITWTATSSGTVTIYLCVGLAVNCVNQDVPLADKIANSGSFTWNVDTSLAASTTKGFGYGIMIISDDDNTIYNWSHQFGISNSAVTSGSATTGGSASVTASVSSSGSSSVPTIITTATGGANSSSIVTPTKSMSVPSSLKTTATVGTTTGSSATTSSTTAASTGAAGAIKVGFGAVVGGVVAALAL